MYYTLWELLICAFKTRYVDYADKAFGKIKNQENHVLHPRNEKRECLLNCEFVGCDGHVICKAPLAPWKEATCCTPPSLL